MSQAITSYKVELMKGTSGTYTRFIEIKDFPDIGGAPEALEKTTTSDAMQTYVEGIQSLSALTFTANYNKTDYEAITALAGVETEWAIYFGENGADGKFTFKGTISAYPTGVGVNEVIGMSVQIVPTTVITFA